MCDVQLLRDSSSWEEGVLGGRGCCCSTSPSAPAGLLPVLSCEAGRGVKGQGLFGDGSHVLAVCTVQSNMWYTVGLLVHPQKRLRKRLRAAVRIVSPVCVHAENGSGCCLLRDARHRLPRITARCLTACCCMFTDPVLLLLAPHIDPTQNRLALRSQECRRMPRVLSPHVPAHCTLTAQCHVTQATDSVFEASDKAPDTYSRVSGTRGAPCPAMGLMPTSATLHDGYPSISSIFSLDGYQGT